LLAPGATWAAEFYAGKTMTMSTHASPGGYDTYLHTLATHFGKRASGKSQKPRHGAGRDRRTRRE
jgi:hypothetical protein